MELKEFDAVKAYARTLNTQNLSHIEPFIADDIEFNPQIQSEPVQGKQKFLDYMAKMLAKIADDAPLWAELGEIPICGRTRPCAVISQYRQDNMVVSATIDIGGNKVKRVNLFFIPTPQEATLTGEIPV